MECRAELGEEETHDVVQNILEARGLLAASRARADTTPPDLAAAERTARLALEVLELALYRDNLELGVRYITPRNSQNFLQFLTPTSRLQPSLLRRRHGTGSPASVNSAGRAMRRGGRRSRACA